MGFWDGGSPPLRFCLDLFLGRAARYDGRDRIWSRAGGRQAGFRGGFPSAFVDGPGYAAAAPIPRFPCKPRASGWNATRVRFPPPP
jgi:hypothetical protein